MNLKELHELARYNKDFDDFKAKIDEKFNGTPTTVVDKTEYKLVKNLGLADVIGRLSFKEIEMLVQLKHCDDSDYGNDEKRCAELIEATRNKVGYTKDDVKDYL